jgi:hypothetical protein
LLEKSNSQLSSESGSCYLGDLQEAYVILDTLDHVTQGELQMYKNNYKTLNLITTALDRNVYDRVAHLKTAHNV